MLRDNLIRLAGVESRLLAASTQESIRVLEDLVHSLEELLEYQDMYVANACIVRLSAVSALLAELRQGEAERRGDLESMVYFAQTRLSHLRVLQQRCPGLGSPDRPAAAA